MIWHRILTITRKDIHEAQQNKAVWLPILIVPLFFVLILPLVLILTISGTSAASQSLVNDPDLVMFLEKMPTVMKEIISGLTEAQTGIVMMLGYLFAPFFLILPLMYATVIAAESFAGERERKTLEALLYTPATDGELFVGKVLAGFIPAVLITWISFIFYALIVNGIGFPVMGRIWFPLPSWYPLIFWVSPAISLLGVSATVLISSKVQTFMGAYQASASLVVLVLALLVGQATGVLYLSVWVSFLLGLVFWLIDGVLVFLAVRGFNRTALLIANS